MTVMTSAPPSSLAECVLQNPKEYVIAVQEQPPDGNPAIECPAPPIAPCLVPMPPTLIGSVKAQEAAIQASIPAGYPAVIGHVRVREEISGTKVDYFTTKSTAIIPSSGSTVQVGLPGLRKDTKHWVSVAFCRNLTGYVGLKGCNCWSEESLVDTTSVGFSSSKPLGAPEESGTNLKLEDDFVRPATTTQTTPNEAEAGGDGLGPNAVWLDGWDPPTPDGAYIDSSGDHAVIANGLIRYAREAKDPNSYAATRFWVTSATSSTGVAGSYNMELSLRHTGEGSSSQFFATKFVFKQLSRDDHPALALLDETQITAGGVVNFADLTLGVDYIDLTGSSVGSNCPGETVNKCTGTPPLLPNTGPVDRNSNYAVLQITAKRDALNSKTDLVAAIGWNCDAAGTGSAYKCANVCCLSKSNTDPERLNTKGRSSYFGHHLDVRYRLEWTRFGDASTGTWP